MTATACDLEDHIFLLWRTGLSAAEIAARLSLAQSFVQAVIDEAGEAVSAAPAASRSSSGAATRRPSRLPSAVPTGRRANAPALVLSRAPRLRLVSSSASTSVGPMSNGELPDGVQEVFARSSNV